MAHAVNDNGNGSYFTEVIIFDEEIATKSLRLMVVSASADEGERYFSSMNNALEIKTPIITAADGIYGSSRISER